jgi:hypothetical protein
MITNLNNLPSSIYRAVCNDSYSDGGSDITVTSLIKPPHMRQLQLKHAAEIVEDAADRIFSLLGQATHTILERAAADHCIVEKRFFVERLGWKVSGQVDLIDLNDGILADFKVTSRHVVGPIKPEHEFQLNANKLLAEENGVTGIKRLEIIAILRDWSLMRVGREKDYPKSQVAVIRSPIWPKEAAEAFLLERIKAHQSPNPPLCTAEERWQKPERYAAMKKGAKRAVKVYDDAKMAANHVATLGNGAKVETRPSEPTRCMHYCNVAQFCSFGKQWLNRNTDSAKAKETEADFDEYQPSHLED